MSAVSTRLAKLEARERERVAEVEATKARQLRHALDRLTPDDLSLLKWNEDDARSAAATEWMRQGGGAYTPGGEAARAWTEAMNETPAGTPFHQAPEGAAAYFTAEAGRCERIALEVQAASEPVSPPQGFGRGDVLTVIRHDAAWWRWYALLAQELGAPDAGRAGR